MIAWLVPTYSLADFSKVCWKICSGPRLDRISDNTAWMVCCPHLCVNAALIPCLLHLRNMVLA